MINDKNIKPVDEDLIIYHPHALHPLRRGVEMGITAVGWFIWAVLCRPLVLAFMWFLGFEIFYEHMIRLGGIKALAAFAFIYFGTIFGMYLFIRGWNYYNATKFRKKNKRRSVTDVSAADLEAYFKFQEHAVEKAQQWKYIVVSFQAGHQISIRKPADEEAQSDKGYFKSG